MKNSSFGEYVKRIIILFVGLSIAHLGVSLFLLADLGSDPFNVFIQGLFKLTQAGRALGFLTHGRVHMAISFAIILVLLVVDKSYVKIGTIICMFFGGPIIDVYNLILGPFFAGEVSMAVRVIVNVVGCMILASGMSIVIKSEAGTGPNDLVALVLSDKLKKQFSIVRIVVDVTFALIGFVLGGTVGLGTIICAFVVGPVAGVVMPYAEKVIKKLV